MIGSAVNAAGAEYLVEGRGEAGDPPWRFVRYRLPHPGEIAGGGSGKILDDSDVIPVFGSALAAKRACRVCGCTDRDCTGCIQRTGQACHWVAVDLCSACIPSTTPTSKDNGLSQ